METNRTTVAISKKSRDDLEKLRKLKSLQGTDMTQKNMIETALSEYIKKEVENLEQPYKDMYNNDR